MIKVNYLFWTFLIGLLASLLSYFYPQGSGLHGYPLTYYRLVESQSTISNQLVGKWEGNFNTLIFALDLLFWWLIFSTLLVIVKNYVLD